MAEPHTDDERRQAAAGDLNVLAILMLGGSSAFALINFWLGTMNGISVVLSILSTLAWSLGLWRRSPVTTSLVKIGFGLGGLLAPILGLLGVVAGIARYPWGWAVLAGAIVYFLFSLLGLEIIERAYQTGVVESYSAD